jgi:hypothetical protein
MRCIMEKRREVDEVGDAELLSEFVNFFGAKRAVHLAGWAVLWGVAGVENGPEFRKRLAAQGVSRATAYRAALDFRRFGEHLEANGGRPVSMAWVVSTLVASHF